MKKADWIALVTALCVIAVSFLLWRTLDRKEELKTVTVGVIYIGDASTAYTNNFIEAMEAVELNFQEQVTVVPKYNIREDAKAVEGALQELADAGCELIFTTSYGYGKTVKQFAEKHPDIQFCQATCDNANEEPLLSNYHTFMGEIYQGRYISGVVAGMKIQELIGNGTLTTRQAKVGYVAAFPYAEVISGYTSFFLGVRSVVPEAVMEVIYTNTWSNFSLEKEAAEELIESGCVVISQHSDTKGAAVACENADRSTVVYHVGYNQGMSDVAPKTSLTGCRINWEPYFVSAVSAVLEEKRIEDVVNGDVHGNDIGAGFNLGWVEMLQVNEVIAADGSSRKVEELIAGFQKKEINVFCGDYIGVDPFDGTDIYDLRGGYAENEFSSAPKFHYVLKDVIRVIR